MASVFLSYDHDDAASARPIVSALEKAGHIVWWDQHIQGGDEYNSEIESAVERADVVVVLWSKRAVKSAWVRDEAAEGRDTGKLIPVSLDGAKPPMGFRQYQTIDLSRSTMGRRVPKLNELLGAIGKLSVGEAPDPGATPGPLKKVGTNRSVLLWFAALLIIGLAGAWAIQKTKSPGASIVAAVVPADKSIASRDLARDLLAKLGQFRLASETDVELVPPIRRKEADLVFEVSESRVGQQARSTVVMLNGRNGRLLWSENLYQTSASAGDLAQQVAVSAATAIRCAAETYSAGKSILGPDGLSAYLNACTDLENRRSDSVADLVPIFRKLVTDTPRFAGGWSKLLTAETAIVQDESSDPHTVARVRGELARDISAARKISLHLPAAYRGQLALVPPTDVSRAMALVDQGIAQNPNSSLLLSYRSQLLHSAGRLDDSVADARRALALDPISPGRRADYIYTLAGSGRLQAALEQLAEADKLWPGSAVIGQVRLIVHNRYGDPRQALQMLRSRGVQTESGLANALLQARIDPKPPNVERAIGEARSAYRQSPDELGQLIQALNEYDRHDELLALMASLSTTDQVNWVDLFFRPAAREFWKDPRSLVYARRTGRLRYWSASGKWPDFCSESDWPYDCKAEGAKLS